MLCVSNTLDKKVHFQDKSSKKDMLSVHWHFREKTRLIKQQFIKTKNFIRFYKSKTVFLTHSNTLLQHSLLFFLKLIN